VDEPVDYSAALLSAVDAVLSDWVVRSVRRFSNDLDVDALSAGEQARIEIGGRLRQMLTTDIDVQRTNPLAVLRSAVRYPTDVLRAAEVPPVRRDEFAVSAFPDDVYNLSPATWADIDQSLTEPGIAWSAWKAHTFLARRRAEGKLTSDP
jgi:hypothetical protein